MSAREDFLRLAASVVAAAGLACCVFAAGTLSPQGSRLRAGSGADAAGLQACPKTGPALAGAFAPLDRVLSVLPMGDVTTPDGPIPAASIHIHPRAEDRLRRPAAIPALAPADGIVTAVERRPAPTGATWRVRLQVCRDLRLTFDGLEAVDLRLARAAYEAAPAGANDGGAGRRFVGAIPVAVGSPLGAAAGFSVALEDDAATPADAARLGIPAGPADGGFAVDPTRARCPLDYLPAETAATWFARLGDAYGLRRARGERPCGTAVVDRRGTAQGVWFPDPAAAAPTPDGAVALAPDSVDAARPVFVLGGRLPSLDRRAVAAPHGRGAPRPAVEARFLSLAPAEVGRGGFVNPPIGQVWPGAVYCYEGLRSGFVGPRLDAALLVEVLEPEPGAPERLRLEVREGRCSTLRFPYAFSGSESLYFR